MDGETEERPHLSESSLEDLAKENISPLETRRLEYVLKTLNEADELEGDLLWKSKVWENCTVEELLGGLIEAEYLFEWYRDTGSEVQRFVDNVEVPPINLDRTSSDLP